jgi:hypothetical protein
MRRLLISLYILLSVGITGCSFKSEQLATMKTWEGTHIDKVVTKWGVPDRTYKQDSGLVSYTWVTHFIVGFGDNAENRQCSSTFTTN